MHEPLTFKRFWGTITHHWRTYVVVGGVAAVLAMVFSTPHFMPPRYRSQALVYPVNLSSYSIETSTDQLLQLLQSNSIRDSLIAKFDLATHWGMDTSARGWRYALDRTYAERVSISKTKYESVDIRIIDEDAVLARDMVLELLRQGDLLARRLQRSKSAELLNLIRWDLHQTRSKLDSVEQRLDALRQTHGLLDYHTQTKEFSKGYMRALAGNTPQTQLDRIREMIRDLEEHGGEFQQLSELYGKLLVEYGEKLGQERQATLDLNKELSYSDLVTYPEVSDKKIYPVRWLVVLIATVAALLLCHVFISLRAKGQPNAGVKPA